MGSLNVMSCISKHFMMIGMSTMGQLLFRQQMRDFLGTGMMMIDLKHVKMSAWEREMLKMSARTFASCVETLSNKCSLK